MARFDAAGYLYLGSRRRARGAGFTQEQGRAVPAALINHSQQKKSPA